MGINKNITHIYEPTPLQCGQAVLAMLCGKSVEEIIALTGNDRETDLKQMFACLESHGIQILKERKAAESRPDLPEIALLSLETPKCWHWSLYYKGIFYDPEYGVLNDFPPSFRRYYWEIKE